MDAFYASVEQRDRPHLCGKPMVVGGSPTGRGVVAAASYEARTYGIHSAMSAAHALRLCPDLIFIKPNINKYRAVSRLFRAILENYTHLIEPLSLDECYLDVTTNRAGLPSATAVARAIRHRVFSELHLTCSAGVAPLKFVAKIASDFDKPNGLTVVEPEQVLSFLAPLPVTALWGVGPSTAKRLHKRGFHTVGQIASLSKSEALQAFSLRSIHLWHMANGRSQRQVKTSRTRRSRGSERTFSEDLHTKEEVLLQLRAIVDRLWPKIENGVGPRCLTLKIRYGDFTTISRSITAPMTNQAQVEKLVLALVDRTEVGARPVRLAGLSFTMSPPTKQPQLSLPFHS